MNQKAEIDLVKKEVMGFLEREGGVKKGHIPLYSLNFRNYHTNLWIHRDVLLSNPLIFEKVFNVLESRLEKKEKEFDAVIGSYPNSAPLVELFSRFFSQKFGRFVRPYYVYEVEGRPVFPQMNEIKNKDINIKFLLVSDMLMSGESALKIDGIVSACKCQIVASLAIIDMTTNPKKPNKKLPVSQNGGPIYTKSLIDSKDLQEKLGFHVWDSKDGNGGCPLCVKGEDYTIPPFS